MSVMTTMSENLSSLVVMDEAGGSASPENIISDLKSDRVVLVKNVSPKRADIVLEAVAGGLGLSERLALQATYASVKSHRKNIGKYFMSVDERDDFQFVIPHSEGNRSMGMQLGALYSFGNSTDGGFTMLQHTDSSGLAWTVLREVVQKIDLCGRKLSAREVAHAKAQYSITIPGSLIAPEDEIVAEIEPLIPGTRRYKVLAHPIPIASMIAEKNVNAYWASIAAPDWDATKQYAALLQTMGLLREPEAYESVAELDSVRKNANLAKAWSSGVKFDELFDARLAIKLEAAELLIFNNMTWTHAATNWTPGSGVRDVVVAFA